MYKIRGSEGKDYGPISADVLRQWISERRVSGSTLVQAEGSNEWKPLSAYPEYAGALPAAPAVPPPPGIMPGQVPRTSGMAISSLVLGICGLFTCGITALIGVILGIVSLVKINKSNGRLSGRGMAIAGICCSAFFLTIGLPFSAAMLLPALAKAKARAQTIRCVNNMKQIGLGVRIWANDHNENFPPNLLSISNEITTPFVLTCPGDRQRNATKSWDTFSVNEVTYEYLIPTGKVTDNPSTVILRCPIHGNIGLADGSVQQKAPGNSKWKSE
ncbi:MAG TPA: DUF4190 domain-containing protein [Verrucomicrobiae bacterium]